MYLHTPAGHLGWGHGLDAKIDGCHPELPLSPRRNHLDLGGGDVAEQGSPYHHRLLQDPRSQLLRVQFTGGDAGPHGSQRPDVTSQGTGVDVTDADDPLGCEFRVQAAAAAPVRWPGRRIPDDISRDLDLPRFVVLIVPSRVADVRSSGQHHLATVGRIGQGLLVTRHPGGED